MGSCSSLFAHRNTMQLQSLVESFGKAFQVTHNAVIVCSSWLGIPTKLQSTWAGLLKHHEEQTWNTLTSNALAANNGQEALTAFERPHANPSFPMAVLIYISIKEVSLWHVLYPQSLFANIRFWTRPHHVLGFIFVFFLRSFLNQPWGNTWKWEGEGALARCTYAENIYLKFFHSGVTRK